MPKKVQKFQKEIESQQKKVLITNQKLKMGQKFIFKLKKREQFPYTARLNSQINTFFMPKSIGPKADYVPSSIDNEK